MRKTAIMLSLIVAGFYSISFAQDSFVVGSAPYSDVEKLKKSFIPFTEYMGKITGMPSSFVVTENYDLLGEKVVSGEISLGVASPVVYVQMKQKYPDKIHYLATCLQTKDGQTRDNFFGYFIVNKNSPFNSLEDLKGKKWGFINKGSTLGYQYPMYMFEMKSINPDTYFSGVRFMEEHTKLTDAIAAWKQGGDNVIDGGVTWDVGFAEAEAKHGDVFRKIGRVGPVPMLPLVVSQKVFENKELRDKLVKALTENVPENVVKSPGFPYPGWKIGSDQDFDIIRRIVKLIK
jgi:phosphonate transport system substrate-binding protein